jgi:hypothetical protein
MKGTFFINEGFFLYVRFIELTECYFYDLAQFLIDMCDKHKICHCRKSIQTSPKNLALILPPSQDNSPLLQAARFPQSAHPSLGSRYAQYWASSTLIGCALLATIMMVNLPMNQNQRIREAAEEWEGSA